MIKVNFEKAEEYSNVHKYYDEAKSHINKLLDNSIDMTGWVKHPYEYDKNEFENIKKVADEIKQNAEVLVSIGIGGSYLGAKAAIDFLSNYYEHRSEQKNKRGVEVIFVGNGLSEKYLRETMEYVKNNK